MDFFMDYFNTVFYSLGDSPYSWGNLANRNYLPLTYIALQPTAGFLFGTNAADQYGVRYTQHGAVCISVFLMVSFFALFHSLTCSNVSHPRRRVLVLLPCAFSGLTAFALERGNTVILSTAFLFYFLAFYRAQRPALRQLSYLCLAISAAMKVFPAIFGILLIWDRRYKDALVTVAYGIVACFAPFLFLKGNLCENVRLFFHALRVHADVYNFRNSYGVLSPLLFPVFRAEMVAQYAFMAGGVLLLIAALCGGSLKEEWKRTLLLSCAMILSSGQQIDYDVMVLFFPMALFFDQDVYQWSAPVFFLAFLLVLNPLIYAVDTPRWLYGLPVARQITQLHMKNASVLVPYLFLLAECGAQFVVRLRRKGNRRRLA